MKRAGRTLALCAQSIPAVQSGRRLVWQNGFPPAYVWLFLLIPWTARLIVPPATAATAYTSRHTVPQAIVERRPIVLPIVDAADIQFALLSTSDGLSQTKVDQIAQDDQGFLWFGTPYGLNRYDGYNFTDFVHAPGNPNSLSGVAIHSLFKDRAGALWVGCDQFLNKFDQATETFTRYPISFVTHISQDKSGILWLATVSGLFRLDPATGQTRQYSHHADNPSSLSSNDVKSSGEDKEGRFWVAGAEGLDEFERLTGKAILHIPLQEPSRRFSFYQDRFGVFWIFRATGHALSVFDRKTNTLRQYSFREPEPRGTALTGVMAMLEDGNGTLWLATHGAGLLKFDRDHQRFIRYRNNPADTESLPQDDVESLLLDREGSIWAGLGRKGLTRFTTRPLPFKRIPHLSDPAGSGDAFVGAIHQDTQGTLWVGTPAALNRIDRKAGKYTSYRPGPPGVNTDVITMCEDRSGYLWVGTYRHGLLRFDPRTGRFKIYRHDPADPHSLSNDIVSRLLVDHNGTLWVATADGLNRFEAATGRFTTYRLDPQGRNVFYLDLVEDPVGTLWLGTEFAGLHRFDPAAGRFILRFEHDMNRPGTLSANRVNSVFFDRSGAMWVGTQNGLDKFDRRTGSFLVYMRRDGLPGNVVSRILEDGRGNLWMSTNNGIARFNPRSGIIKSYSTADGLPGPDLTGWGAGFKSSAGEMFFGGFSGGASFFPDKVADASYTPPVVLTDFRLFGNPVEIGSHSPLQKSISFTKELLLSPRQNVFSLRFAALSYTNPATNRYRYKLDGLDHHWIEAGSDRRLATYTTLPAGAYTFHAQGATNTGAWSEPGVSLLIKVLPPFWATWPFGIGCAILLLVSLWYAHRLRLRHTAWQFNMRLEERVGERTRIARDLHDTLLQSFQGLLYRFQAARNVLPERPGEAIRTLDSALARAEQAIAESREAIQDLRSDPAAPTDLARLLTAIGEELGRAQAGGHDSPSFHVTVEGPPRPLRPILRDEVYLIAGEALRNAFQHARARRIETEIRYHERALRIRVRDDGQGIDRQVIDAGGRAQHWGLPGIHERASRAGARLDVWTKKGASTEVELTVPASLAYTSPPRRGALALFRKKGGIA